MQEKQNINKKVNKAKVPSNSTTLRFIEYIFRIITIYLNKLQQQQL